MTVAGGSGDIMVEMMLNTMATISYTVQVIHTIILLYQLAIMKFQALLNVYPLPNAKYHPLLNSQLQIKHPWVAQSLAISHLVSCPSLPEQPPPLFSRRQLECTITLPLRASSCTAHLSILIGQSLIVKVALLLLLVEPRLGTEVEILDASLLLVSPLTVGATTGSGAFLVRDRVLYSIIFREF